MDPSLLKTKDTTTVFLKGVSGCEEFHQAQKIIKNNSKGKAWLIGGFVFRTIAKELYHSSKPKIDLDFVIEKTASRLIVPRGWKIIKNRFGNPKIIKKEKQIDFIPLKNIYSIKYRKLKPTIDNFLSGVPLTIQSIAFDIKNNRIIGEVGINAIKKRIIKVNNLYFAKYAAKKKGKTLNQYIRNIAEDLSFRPIYP